MFVLLSLSLHSSSLATIYYMKRLSIVSPDEMIIVIVIFPIIPEFSRLLIPLAPQYELIDNIYKIAVSSFMIVAYMWYSFTIVCKLSVLLLLTCLYVNQQLYAQYAIVYRISDRPLRSLYTVFYVIIVLFKGEQQSYKRSSLKREI